MRIASWSFLLLFSVSNSASAISWDNRDAATRQIAECFGVYANLGQQLQIADRTGAATNYLSRAATTVTVNMFLNRDGESVPGERLQLMTSAQNEARASRGDDIEKTLREATECDEELPGMVQQMRNEPPLFGKPFLEFKTEMLEMIKSQLGL